MAGLKLRKSKLQVCNSHFKGNLVAIMKRTKISKRYFLLLFITFAFLSACSTAPEIGESPPEAVCSSIIDVKCVRCHYKTRICDALGTKSVRQWKKSIKFMMKQGAALSVDEQNKVIACLSSLPEGSNVVCK